MAAVKSLLMKRDGDGILRRNLYCQSSRGWTALDYAIKSGSSEIVKLLLKLDPWFPFQVIVRNQDGLDKDTILLLLSKREMEFWPVNEQNWWLQRQSALLGDEKASSFKNKRRDSVLNMEVAAPLLEDMDDGIRPLPPRRRHSF